MKEYLQNQLQALSGKKVFIGMTSIKIAGTSQPGQTGRDILTAVFLLRSFFDELENGLKDARLR